MSMENHDSLDGGSTSGATTEPEHAADAGHSAGALEFPLTEFERFIGEILEGPPEYVDRDVVVLVRRATKVRSKLAASLAVRALRLERGLRQAQQQVIRLQWELAQLKQRPEVRYRTGDDVEN